MKTDQSKPEEQPSEERVDVLIYEIKTRTVSTVAGSNLRKHARHKSDMGYSAERRIEAVAGRLNDNYTVGMFAVGKFKPGDVLPEGADIE